ncbi:MAG: hypothetical protein ACJA02_000328 [Myxococcota bacterium]|jgi:hypothetical protein
MKSIIKHPIFRIAGILAILYYGLFHDKSSPDNLGNRLSSQNIKSNLRDVTSKSLYIIDNVKKAEKISKSYAEQESKENTDEK